MADKCHFTALAPVVYTKFLHPAFTQMMHTQIQPPLLPTELFWLPLPTAHLPGHGRRAGQITDPFVPADFL